MRKVLSLLTVITFTSSTISSVISCSQEKDSNKVIVYDRSKLATKIVNNKVYIQNVSKTYNTSDINVKNLIRNALRSLNNDISIQDSQYIGFKNASEVLKVDVENDVVLKIDLGNNKFAEKTIKVIPAGNNANNINQAIKEEVVNNKITIPNVIGLKATIGSKIYTNSSDPKLKTNFDDYIKKLIQAQNPYMTTNDINALHILENKEINLQGVNVKVDWYTGNTSTNANSLFNFKLSNNNKINNPILDNKFDTYNNKNGNIYLSNLSSIKTNNVVKQGANLYNILFNNNLPDQYEIYKAYIQNALKNTDKITLTTTGINNDKDFLYKVEQNNEMQASQNSFNEYETFMNKAYDMYKNKTVADIQKDYRDIRPQNNSLDLSWIDTHTIGTKNKAIMTKYSKFNYGVFNTLFGTALSSHIIKYFQQINIQGQIADAFSYNPRYAVSSISLNNMNDATYIEDLKPSYQTGWQGDYAYSHIFTHEYGHAFDNGLNIVAQKRSQLNIAIESGTFNPVSYYSIDPSQFLVKYLDHVGHIGPNNKNWSWLFANALVSSNYGRGSRYQGYNGQPDLFAEAFAQWMYQPLSINFTDGSLVTNGTGADTSLKYNAISSLNRGWEVLNNFFLNVLPSTYNLIPLKTY